MTELQRPDGLRGRPTCVTLCVDLAETRMATNLNLDDDLIALAVRLGKHPSKRDAVNAALREYVAHLKRLQAIDAFGDFEFDDDYDYKKARAAR